MTTVPRGFPGQPRRVQSGRLGRNPFGLVSAPAAAAVCFGRAAGTAGQAAAEGGGAADAEYRRPRGRKITGQTLI